MHKFVFAVCVLLVAAAGCASNPSRAESAFDQQKLREIDAAVEQAITEKKCPGAVVWIERNGASYHKAYGNRALLPSVEPMTEDTIFDAASLTKVIATTPSIMILVEAGKVNLDAPVHTYINEFKRDGKEKITVRHLMTHTSGLRAGLSPRPAGSRTAIQMACQEKTINEPGTTFLYSDINYILLGEIVARVGMMPLDKFASEEVFLPLKMRNTRYLPFVNWRPRIAPTEREGTNYLRGVVHDPTARAMERVAGHAGVFTTASDLARFARMMLNGGELDGIRLFSPETVRLMTTVQSPETVNQRRGLGWDIDTGFSRPRGDLFPLGSYGHTGFTGTALWIDPFSKSFWIFLSNRVHPDRSGNILALQKTLGTLSAQAIKGFDFQNVPGALPPRQTNQSGTVPPAAAALKTP